MTFTVKRFVKHSSVYAIGNIANRVGALILLPLYTTYLSLAEYGILELFYSTSSVVTSLLGMGIGHATLRFYFEYGSDKERGEVVSTSLISSFLITLTGVSLLSVFNTKLSLLLFDSAEYSYSFYTLYAILVMEISTQICFAYIRAKEYSKFFVYVNLIRLFIQVTVNYYIVAILHMGVNGILIGNSIAVGTSWVFVLFVTFKETGISFNRKKLIEMLKYSYPFYGSSILGVVFKNADRILLKSMASLEAVGVYSIALKIAQIPLELFHQPFKKNYGAFRFAIMKEKNAEDLQIKLTKYMIIGMSFFSLIIGLFSIDILKIMSPKEYWDAVNYLPILLTAVCIQSLIYPFQTGIMISKKTKYAFYISSTNGAVFILLNMLLIPILDAYGASIAFALSGLLAMFLTYRFSQGLIKINYQISIMVKIFLLFFTAYILSILVNIFFITSISIILKVVILFIFPLSLYHFNSFSSEEKESIKSLINLFRVKLVSGITKSS